MATSGKTLDKLRQAVAANPNSAETHQKLGTALLTRSVTEAEKELQQAVQLDPKNVKAWVNLGGVRLTRWDFEGCAQANQRAIECDPDAVLAHYNLGLARMYQKQPQEMVACFRKVVELDPRHAAGHYHLAVALLELDQVAEAQLSLARARALGHEPPPDFLKSLEQKLRKSGAVPAVVEIAPKEK